MAKRPGATGDWIRAILISLGLIAVAVALVFAGRRNRAVTDADGNVKVEKSKLVELEETLKVDQTNHAAEVKKRDDEWSTINALEDANERLKRKIEFQNRGPKR